MSESLIHKVRFDDRGLIPAVIQDASSHEIVSLMHLDNNGMIGILQRGQTSFTLNVGEGKKSEATYKLVDVSLNPDGSSLTVLVRREGDIAEDARPLSLLRDFSDSQKSSGGE